MHHPFAVDRILLVDTSKDIRTHAPLTNVTPYVDLSYEAALSEPAAMRSASTSRRRIGRKKLRTLIPDLLTSGRTFSFVLTTFSGAIRMPGCHELSELPEPTWSTTFSLFFPWRIDDAP